MGANFVHLVLWKEIRRIMERRASAGRLAMMMMEVSIHDNVNVTTVGKRLTKSRARKTCGTALDEDRRTTSGEQCWNGGQGNEVGGRDRGRRGQAIFRGGYQIWGARVGSIWSMRYWSAGSC